MAVKKDIIPIILELKDTTLMQDGAVCWSDFSLILKEESGGPLKDGLPPIVRH